MKDPKPTYLLLTITPDQRDRLDEIAASQYAKTSRKGIAQALLWGATKAHTLEGVAILRTILDPAGRKLCVKDQKAIAALEAK